MEARVRRGEHEMTRTLALIGPVVVTLALDGTAAAQAPTPSPSPSPVACSLFATGKAATPACGGPQACAERLRVCLQELSDTGSCLGRLVDAAAVDPRKIEPCPVTFIDRAQPVGALGDVNRYLAHAWRAFEAMKRWEAKLDDGLKESDPAWGEVAEAHEARNRAWSVLQQVLEDRGLYESVFAELVSGTSGATVNRENADVDPDMAQEVAYIAFESRRRSLGRGFEGSFHGRVGFQPVLALYDTTNAAPSLASPPPTNGSPSLPKCLQAGGTDPACLPAFQKGFVWDLGTSVSRRLGAVGEASGFARIGQTSLVGKGVTADTTDTNTPAIALPIGRERGETEWVREIGVKLIAFYDRDPEDMPHERQLLSPLLEVSAGARYDDRFSAAALGLDANQGARYFFRFLVNLKMPGGPELVGKPVAFTFGVEHEGQLGKSDGLKLPAGTRVIFRGDLNLIRTLTGDGR
jgi:hypothetical protein